MTRNLVIGAALSALVVVAALLSFLWTPYDHTALNIPDKLQTPNATHWLGTDHFGRDILSMIMVGARTSIAVAFVAVGIGMAAGVPLGLWAAARKGSWLDELIMRGNDLVFAFPSLVIAILITATRTLPSRPLGWTPWRSLARQTDPGVTSTHVSVSANLHIIK